MRARIFEKMAQSKHTAAHFTFVEECDVTALKAAARAAQATPRKPGVKLTFLPFIVKAVVAALEEAPDAEQRARRDDARDRHRKYYNIGIAASTDAGLIVPVVKDADRESLLDIAREIERLADGRARPASRSWRTCRGPPSPSRRSAQQGGLFATPIINFPEVGILGVHQIKQKPVVRDGQIVIGDVMLLSLSFDHRIVDGHVGAAFAYDIIEALQQPEALFLQMV